MQALRIVAAVMFIAVAAAALAQDKEVGPNWPTDKYKAFEEARKKNRLVFLYYTSTT